MDEESGSMSAENICDNVSVPDEVMKCPKCNKAKGNLNYRNWERHLFSCQTKEDKYSNYT